MKSVKTLPKTGQFVAVWEHAGLLVSGTYGWKGNRLFEINILTLDYTEVPLETAWPANTVYLTNKLSRTKTVAYEPCDKQIALYLYDSIKKFNPDHGKPNIEVWAVWVEKIRRIDEKSLDEIREMIDFAHSKPFWRQNILSPHKLRKHWDRLTIERQENGTHQQNHQKGFKNGDSIGGTWLDEQRN